jgi:DNA-binding transcriptional LysR family regulator
MDTQALTAFLAVAESGSFSTAAERLFITQPAVSKRIAQLEQQLGTRLFDRVGRRIRLTEAGEALLPRARQVLRRFSREYPDVKLDIHFIDSEEAWEAVLHGDLEMGVVTLPPQPDPRLHSQAVWQDPLVFMAAPEHPLARLERVPLETLTGYSAILPSPVTFTRRIVESLFEEQALTLNISMSTNYLETIHMMVSIGLGWSVLPETMLDDSVVRLNVDTALPVRRLGVVTHPGRSRSNAAGAFLDILNSAG